MQAKKEINKQLGIVKSNTQEGKMRRIREIVSDLSRPVPDHHIRHRKQGGANLSYIEWHTACNYLDDIAPGWGWQIVTIADYSGITVVHGALSIPSADGVVVRHATGIEDTDNKGYGDPVSNASAMAFKRAAALFGLARHLYQKPDSTKKQEAAKPAVASRSGGLKAAATDEQPQNKKQLDAEILELSKALLESGMSKGNLQMLFAEVTGKSKRGDLTTSEQHKFIAACKEELCRLAEVDEDDADNPFAGDAK